MFQTLGGLVSPDSRTLQLVVGAVVLVVILAVIYGLYRLVFAHRLRVPGAARGRAPRLGVVDVFVLDGQRQLVIVRRDNIEHLLMIGGPNDLVIESEIVRSPTNGAREAAKAPAVEPAPEAPTPAPIPRPVAPTPPPRRAPPRETPAPAAAVVVPPPAESAAPVVSAEPIPAPDYRSRAPLAPRTPAESARPVAEPAPAKPAEPVVAVEPKSPPEISPPRKPAPPRPAPAAARPNLPSPITPLRPRQGAPEVTIETAKPAAPKAPEVTVAPPPAAAAPAVIVTPPPPHAPGEATPASPDKRPRKDEAFYDLESLEAEMARLLGRDS